MSRLLVFCQSLLSRKLVVGQSYVSRMLLVNQLWICLYSVASKSLVSLLVSWSPQLVSLLLSGWQRGEVIINNERRGMKDARRRGWRRGIEENGRGQLVSCER